LTTVTCSTDDLNSIAGNYRNAKDLDKNNVIKGWYIEGPYISIKRKGAHNQKLIRPIDTNVLKKLKNLLPHVTKILAVAPEFKNNLSKYKIIKKDYFLATGHSDANY
jgi:N-acetylglucosamine-6-phosphate deacetylase